MRKRIGSTLPRCDKAVEVKTKSKVKEGIQMRDQTENC